MDMCKTHSKKCVCYVVQQITPYSDNECKYLIVSIDNSRGTAISFYSVLTVAPIHSSIFVRSFTDYSKHFKKGTAVQQNILGLARIQNQGAPKIYLVFVND